MRLTKLRIDGLRCLEAVELVLSSGINVFIGDNGAGKTSVLEAVFLLSHARSFRIGSKDALLRMGAGRLSVFAELSIHAGVVSRLGIGREGSRWDARINGDRVSIGELVADCAVVCFEPGSHALIAGAAEERRRFLDWGVFHVEPEFLLHWRRYQRALKQRNSLLRGTESHQDALFLPWEAELAQSASWIDHHRATYMHRLQPRLAERAGLLLPELGTAALSYRRGWIAGVDLGEQLRESRGRDRARGHTSLGAHRADWRVVFENSPMREHLSRGQEKLTALACLLAQAEVFAERRGEWPIVCLDDLASELDQKHQAALVDQLVSAGTQVLVTGTEMPQALQSWDKAVFHVEQGQLTRLL